MIRKNDSDKLVIKEENYSILDVGIYKQTKPDWKLDELVKVLSSISKINRSLSNKTQENLFTDLESEQIAQSLISVSKASQSANKYIISFIRPDPIAQYSRLYRSRILFYGTEHEFFLGFNEIDENQIYGIQYTFADWGYPSYQEIECVNKPNVAIVGALEKNYQFQNDSNCEKIKLKINYNKIYIHTQKIIAEIKPDMQPNSIEKRLGELEMLSKKGIITKKEYIKKRKEILDEL
jgi:hypothetical protein